MQCRAESSHDDILEELVHEKDHNIYKVKVQVHQTYTTNQQQAQSLNEDILEELVNGFNHSTALDKGKVLWSTDASICCSEGASELTLKLTEPCRLRALQGGTMKILAEFVSPAMKGGNFSHLSTFGTLQPSFSRALVLLGDLLTWSCPSAIGSDTISIVGTPLDLLNNNVNGHGSRAKSSPMGPWPVQVQEFGEPLHLSFFHLKLVLCEAHLLCVDLEYPEPLDVRAEGEGSTSPGDDLGQPPAELRLTAELQEELAQGLVPVSARGLALGRPGLKNSQKPGCRHLCDSHILMVLVKELNYSSLSEKWKMHEANDSRQCLPEKSKEDIVELADGFSYAIGLYSRPVPQARNTMQCRAESSHDDILEELVHEKDHNIYKVKVQVHQTYITNHQQAQSLNEDILEELVNGFNYSTALDKGKVLWSTDASICFPEGASVLTLKLTEPCRLRALQGGIMKTLAEFMSPAMKGRNFSHLSTFRTLQPSFCRDLVLLDDLLTWSCPSTIGSDTISIVGTPLALLNNNANGRGSRAKSPPMGPWPVQVQEFGEPLRLSLHLKLALWEAHLLCVDLEYPEPQDVRAEEPPAELRLTAELQEGLAQGLVPVSARGLALGSPGLKNSQKPGCRHLCDSHILMALVNELNYSSLSEKWKMHEANDSRQCLPETASGDIMHQLVTPTTLCMILSTLQESLSSCHPKSVHVRQYHSFVQSWIVKSKEDIVELADGFSYAIGLYSGPVPQARNTMQCRAESSHDDILEDLVHEKDHNIYKVKVQVHQTYITNHQQAQSLNEDILEELVNGFNYSTALDKGKVLWSTDASICFPEGASVLTLKWTEPCRLQALQGGIMKTLAEFVSPVMKGRNFSHLCTFRTLQPSFYRDLVLLDDLLTWSCPLSIGSDIISIVGTPLGLLNNKVNGRGSRAKSSPMGPWPVQVQEFGEPLRLSFLHLKLALCEAHLLCVDLEYPEPQDVRAEEPPAELRLTAELQEGLAQGLVPVSARGLALGRPGLKNSQKPGCRHLCDSHILMALVNESNYSSLSEKWKMHEANDSRQCLPEALKGPMLKNVADIVALDFLSGNISLLTMFNSRHAAFSRSQMFLDDLLSRTIASPEGAWLDQVQEFSQPLRLSWFHLKQDLVSFNFADSQQLWEAQVLGVNLEYPAPQGASPEDALSEFEGSAHPQEVYADLLAPRPASCLTLAWPGLMQCLKAGWRLLVCFIFLALLGVLSFILNK
ncbi:uncharacterized protein LOC119044118 [Artibeus jamaicensis]|uniref:uncharacterized protein LOC119044118 n=1 Tax=Artibeus jamaicensis TaxID=9417 RepID=UPI00235A714A|nr:uncharacterized protein LOC119044118 [Artibeus jamaicensis]